MADSVTVAGRHSKPDLKDRGDQPIAPAEGLRINHSGMSRVQTMIRQRFFGLITLTTCLLGQAAYAATFQAPIDDTRWEIEVSHFACRMMHPIPAFGHAVFEHEAGESLQFSLIPTQSQQMQGTVRLIAQASSWQPGLAPEVIGEMAVQSGRVRVNGSNATQMMAALYRGMSPTFSGQNWYQSAQPVSVGISAVNFKSAYNDYMDCVAQLLPVNYRQIARTAVLFPSAQFMLSDATRDRLDLIVQYVQHDDTVTTIYVDGHSDNVGRRLLNRDLSKRRAEEVTNYLLQRGIDESMIITRYHGDRYPVVANDTPENRTRNRRVTIRLERE